MTCNHCGWSYYMSQCPVCKNNFYCGLCLNTINACYQCSQKNCNNCKKKGTLKTCAKCNNKYCGHCIKGDNCLSCILDMMKTV